MKKLIALIVLCFSVFTSDAQVIYNSSGRKVAKKPAKKSGFDRDKLVLGGDFRLAFGQGVSVGIAPMAGYQIAKNLTTGLRLGYGYNRVKFDYNNLPMGSTTNIFSTNSYSGGVWARYLIWQSIYIHSEYEYNIFDAYYQNEFSGLYEKRSLSSPSILLGLGFKQPISDRTSFNTTILFDVLNDPNSYYRGVGGVDLRFGIMVGF